jgi:hypothetical protein
MRNTILASYYIQRKTWFCFPVEHDGENLFSPWSKILDCATHRSYGFTAGLLKQNETKQNKTKRNETKRNETKRNETKRKETKQNKTKQNKTKQNKRIGSDQYRSTTLRGRSISIDPWICTGLWDVFEVHIYFMSMEFSSKMTMPVWPISGIFQSVDNFRRP